MRNFIVLLLTTALFLSLIVVTGTAQEPKTKNQKPKPSAKQDGDRDRDGDREEEAEEEDDPDLPPNLQNFDKGEYLRARDEQFGYLRGLPYPDPQVRNRAIFDMVRAERAQQAARAASPTRIAADPVWTPLGPAPISGVNNSGRTTCVAIHPTNPNIAYVGTAQGGLYRTLNGGTTWTPMLDGALSLAIGAVAIAPSDPTIVYVGTGEAHFSGDSFFGVGVYRITNADTSPVVAGPLNKDAGNNDIFTGRSISSIAVLPTDANTFFVGSTTGTSGIGGGGIPAPPALGLYRTTNGLAASPTFTRLTVPPVVQASVTDCIFEPGNPNNMLVGVRGNAAANEGGIYRTTNALSATPTFTQTKVAVTLNARFHFAINNVGGVITVIAATGDGTGTVYKSVDAGVTWPTTLTAANGFCNPQCFYDIAVAIDPTDANFVYIGGSPSAVFRRSINGGTNFTTFSSGLHVDTHVIAVAPSDPTKVYFGSDGGIWRTNDAKAATVVWTNLNNSTYSATQFQGLTLHPTDRFSMLGGTQDNGTEYYLQGGGAWIRSDGGDGGFAYIDQNATNIVNVTAYHTYFNQTGTQIGFSRATTTDTTNPGDPNWGGLLGCGGTANGISCTDATLFYAPMVGGPGNPNTLYFGTDRLYRSDNMGTTMVVVSQAPLVTGGARLSAIAISKQNDNVRLVGSTTGQVFATTTGSSTMTDVTGPIPSRYVGRIAIDPTNANVAYVALTGWGLSAGQHVWKTTNLLTGTPTWTASGTGIPDVPTNAFAIDPANTQNLFAGTDIGVFRSRDGGATWTPFSNGLPRVAVFGLEIHPVFGFVRIATHGRGVWENSLVSTRATVADFDGDGKTDLSVFRPSAGSWFYLNSSNGAFAGQSFGLNGDQIAPGDFDGDGKTDFSVFRNGNWFILQSSNSVVRSETFGLAGDKPVAADYDGDGKADLAVFRAGTWYIINSNDSSFRAVAWGLASDLPVPRDYDGDGKADLSTFRSSNGSWNILQSATNSFRGEVFGQNGDRPVAGDYDGDGKADLAVYRPGDNTWYLLRSTAGFSGSAFGANGDIPSEGDYDGDGKTDLAVFRPSEGNWYIIKSSNGAFQGTNFGLNGDVPVPAGYNP
jgi:photosystem II stability/assembly factor-like uncharacterized protein